jgi:hypothetical protein
VDNRANTYGIQATLTGGTIATRLIGLRVFYRRQVSPAPAVATFSDVPTSHPFFQFIEALARSGITSGCGGGNFCPDAPLTRGQMAVFLSLGLGAALRAVRSDSGGAASAPSARHHDVPTRERR